MAASPLTPYVDASPSSRAIPLLSSVDTLTFEGVYEEHFAFVWRSALRLGVPRSSVDDVVQEIFLVVHRRLKDYEHRSSLKTWLFGIVRRVVAHQRRTDRRKPSHTGRDEATDLDAFGDASHVGPERRAQEAEAVRLLDRILNELDDDKREAFILSELEEMTIAEVAEALGQNPNTMASRIRAARTAFEQAVLRYEERSPSASGGSR